MGFQDAVKRCFSQYATFSGRARRPEYWYFVLFVFLGAILFSIIDAVIFGVDAETGEQRRVLVGLFQLATILPMIAVAFRRLHDTGRPGWYILLPMGVSIAVFLAMMLGVVAFSAAQNAGADEDALRGSAMVLGTTGMIVVGIVQLVLMVLIIYWMTRPTEPNENAYGPVPD